jgi:hypothetical protein
VITPHVVTAWSPGRGSGWRQTVPPGWLLHGERRHLLTSHPDGGTRYQDVFWMSGPLAGIAAAQILAPVRAGLEGAALGLARHLAGAT